MTTASVLLSYIHDATESKSICQYATGVSTMAAQLNPSAHFIFWLSSALKLRQNHTDQIWNQLCWSWPQNFHRNTLLFKLCCSSQHRRGRLSHETSLWRCVCAWQFLVFIIIKMDIFVRQQRWLATFFLFWLTESTIGQNKERAFLLSFTIHH